MSHRATLAPALTGRLWPDRAIQGEVVPDVQPRALPHLRQDHLVRLRRPRRRGQGDGSRRALVRRSRRRRAGRAALRLDSRLAAPRPGCRAGRRCGSAGSQGRSPAPSRRPRSRDRRNAAAMASRSSTTNAGCALRAGTNGSSTPTWSSAATAPPVVVRAEPHAAAPAQAGGLVDLEQAEPVGVEGTGGVLAAGRAGDLDVVEGIMRTVAPPRRSDGTAAPPARRAGRVRRPEPPLELLLEAGPQVVGQRLQGRPRAGAGDPGEDGVLALEHVEVGRLPRVHLAAESLERLEVDDRVVRARDGDARRVGGVRRLRGQLGADRVARLAEVARAPGRPASRPRCTRPTSAGSRSRWPGTHCSVAFETRTSTGSASPVTQSRRSATSNATAGVVSRAVSIISALESRPATCASGQRSTSRAVRLPGPQPRSTTEVGLSAPTRATSSTKGRPRSSA